MNLRDFQEAFLKQITHAGSETEEIDPLIHVLTHDSRMTPQERLDIYVRDYRGRLYDVLKDHYPQTYNYLGDDKFLDLYSTYINAHPPSSYSLRYWGEHLAEFCISDKSFNHPNLIDLVRFEWLVHDLYDGEDASVLSSSTLSQVDPESWIDLRFQIVPCFKLWQADTNVAELWQGLKNNSSVSSKNDRSYLVHWRKDCEVYFRELELQEWNCLKRLSQGETFGDLCEYLSKTLSEDEAPLVISQYLQSWINDSMIQETSFD